MNRSDKLNEKGLISDNALDLAKKRLEKENRSLKEEIKKDIKELKNYLSLVTL